MLNIAAVAPLSMLFATFAPHVLLPRVGDAGSVAVSKTVAFVSPSTNETKVAKLRYSQSADPECYTLACAHEDALHFFRYNRDDNVLLQCFWHDPRISVHQQAAVFAGMRKWYADASNSQLQFAFGDGKECVSWTLSTLMMNR